MLSKLQTVWFAVLSVRISRIPGDFLFKTSQHEAVFASSGHFRLHRGSAW